jgi:diguanylate cyclase (GGDEF)-like protein
MRRNTWALYLAAVAFVGGLYFVVPTTTVSKLVLYNGVGLSSVVAILVGIRRNRPADARAWRFIALGAASFLSADLCYYILEAVSDQTPFPSPADALFLSMYPLVIAGLAVLLRKASPGRDLAGVVDAGMVAVATFAVLGVLIMDRYLVNDTLGLAGRLISIAYPVMDVALVAVAVRLAGTVHLRHPSYALLTTGLLSLLVADTIYGVLNSAGLFQTGGVADAFWLGFYSLIGAAALHPAIARKVEPRPVRIGVTKARLAGMCLVVVAVPVINLIWGKPIDKVLMNVSAIIMFLLVLVRMMGLMTVVQTNEQRALHDARHDALTGLANRVLFGERVEQFVRQPSDGVVAVLFVDLDDFKVVNDSLGHAVGDELLITVSERLRACVRDVDVVARLSGDEFAILLESAVDRQDAIGVAQRAQNALAEPIELGEREVLISASVGICVERRSEVERADVLLRAADVAMYRAKRKGKGRFEFFEPGMHLEAVERLDLRTDLQIALERGQFRLHFQPITRTGTREVHAVEALVRWEHPTRGLVYPDRFIPLAEQTGQIVPIGRWVLREACLQIMRWQRDHPDYAPKGVSVNLSVRQLHDPTLLSDVADALSESGLEPSALTLEITESMLIDDTDRGSRVLDQLKALRVKIAIDDFGTGYSSLSYLRRFPVDTIKIDRSFVKEMEASPTSEALVRAIIDLSHTLQVATVAEGIETKKQEAILARLGCDFGQGFLIGRPVPADQLERLLVPTTSGRARRPSTQLDVEVSTGMERLERVAPDLGLLHSDLDVPVMARIRWAQSWGEVNFDWEPLTFVVRHRHSGLVEAAALLATRPSAHGLDVVAMGHGAIGLTRFPSRSDRGARLLASTIVDHLGAVPDPWRFELCQLPERDPVAVLLAQRLPHAELVADQWVPRVEFGDCTKVDDLLSHNMRRQIRKAHNRIATDGHTVAFGTARTTDAIEAVLETLEDIHVSRDHSTRLESDLDDPRARELWRRIVRNHAEGGLVEISSILVDEKVAGYVIGILDGRSYRVFDGHFDSEYSRYSPGRLVESAVLERAMLDPRFSELDWMAGVAAEKILVSNCNEARMRLMASSAAPGEDRSISISGPLPARPAPEPVDAATAKPAKKAAGTRRRKTAAAAPAA